MMPLPSAFANPEARAIAEQGAHLACMCFQKSLWEIMDRKTERYPVKPTWAGDERATMADMGVPPLPFTNASSVKPWDVAHQRIAEWEARATVADALPAGLPSALANAAHGGMRSAGRYAVYQSVGGKWEARAMFESFKLAEPHLENARAEGYEACIVRVDEPPPLIKGRPILANAFMGNIKPETWYEVRQSDGGKWEVRAVVESRELAEPHAENARAEGYEVHIVRVRDPA